MAKIADTAPDEFAGIELDVYTPETVEGVYDREVRAMLAADEKLKADHPEEFENGKRTSIKVTTANDDKAKAKTIREFQDSAKAHNRTARKVHEAPQGSDGQILITFILVPKQNRTRKAKDSAPVTADVPEEVAPADEAEVSAAA